MGELDAVDKPGSAVNNCPVEVQEGKCMMMQLHTFAVDPAHHTARELATLKLTYTLTGVTIDGSCVAISWWKLPSLR